MAKVAGKNIPYRGSLAAAFDFDDETISANRAGRLTERQHALLDTGDRRVRRYSPLLFGAVLVIVVASLVSGLGRAGGDEPMRIAIFASCAVFMVIVIATFGRTWWSRRDMRARRVSVIEGPAKRTLTSIRPYLLTVAHGLRLALCELDIGREKLHLAEPSQLEAFEEGGHYRLFIIRSSGSPIVLSAERLDEPPPD